jgi:hypothetical protein
MRNLTTYAGLGVLAVLAAAPTAVRAQCDPTWQTAIGAPGAGSTVWSALAVDEPSAIGPAVYVGGQFTTIGGVSAARIARWNGTTWSALGTGTPDVVYALIARDGWLYAGGGFANAGGQPGTHGIAKWDGTNWFTVGGGMAQNNSGLRAFAFLGNDLYAGGYQNELGGVTLHKLGRWNGVAWSALPGDPIGSTDSVSALGIYDDGDGEALYVGGTFTAAGGNSYARNIFRTYGTSVTPLGRGADGVVEALAVWNGSLYVGGHFTRVYQADGTEVIANKIARWDGTAWSALSSGMNTVAGYHVWTLNVFDRGTGDALYAGGNFTSAGGATIRDLAVWNGTTWDAVGSSNLNGGIYALTTSGYDGGLYAGGTFTTAGTPSANRIVRWAGPRPVTPLDAAAAPDAIVLGDSSTLTASVAGSTIYWYTGGCGGTSVGTGSPLVVSPTATTTYYARAFNGTCFSYACDSVTVTVDCTPPTPANAAADPQEILVGESSTLTASVPGSTIYWYTDGCATTPVGTGSPFVVSPLETTTYYARAYNGTCYSDACDSVTVTVNCLPPHIIDQPIGGVICTPGAPTLQLCVTAEGSGTLHYQWRRGTLTLIGQTDSCYTASQAGAYSCVVTDDCTAVVSDVADVHVAAPAAGDFDGNGVANLADFAELAACLAGPGAGVPEGCACVNVVPDADIDLVDFAVFQTVCTD